MSHLRSHVPGTLVRLTAAALVCSLFAGCVAVTGTSGVKEPPSAKDCSSQGQSSSSKDCKDAGSK